MRNEMEMFGQHTRYSNTCKMAEKRQHGLAEMWQVTAPKTKKKKDVPDNCVM